MRSVTRDVDGLRFGNTAGFGRLKSTNRSSRFAWLLCHVVFLVLRFEGSLSHLPHATDRFVRALAQFHQQAGGDGPGAPQPPTAMHEDIEAQAQPIPECLACDRPPVLEALCRR